jgi:hypothetical protein
LVSRWLAATLGQPAVLGCQAVRHSRKSLVI